MAILRTEVIQLSLRNSNDLIQGHTLGKGRAKAFIHLICGRLNDLGVKRRDMERLGSQGFSGAAVSSPMVPFTGTKH